MKDFLTVKEAAIEKKLSEGHIRQLCINSKIKGVQKHGRAWVIPKQSLEEYKPGLRGFALVQARKEAERQAQLDEINTARVRYAAQKLASA